MSRKTQPTKPTKLPLSYVDIGGWRVAVVLLDMTDKYGAWSHDQRTIFMNHDTRDDPRLFRVILRHEMVHAALSLGGVGFCERYEEECIARCLDTMFWPAWERVEQRLAGGRKR